MNQSKKENLMIYIFVAVIIFCLSLSFCGTAKAEEPLPIGLTMGDWQKVVVGLEDYRICQEEREYIRQENELLEKENNLYKENNSLLKETVDLQDKKIGNLEKEIKLNDKACENAIKMAKPTLWDDLKKYAIGAVGGILIMLVLL